MEYTEELTHVTATGATVAAFILASDDDEEIDDPCVWCDGLGTADGGADEEERMYRPELAYHNCGACRGTGVAGKTTRGELRKRAWDEMVFNVDARRAELMDRDICPDCGTGGCGGECHFTAEDWDAIDAARRED